MGERAQDHQLLRALLEQTSPEHEQRRQQVMQQNQLDQQQPPTEESDDDMDESSEEDEDDIYDSDQYLASDPENLHTMEIITVDNPNDRDEVPENEPPFQDIIIPREYAAQVVPDYPNNPDHVVRRQLHTGARGLFQCGIYNCIFYDNREYEMDLYYDDQGRIDMPFLNHRPHQRDIRFEPVQGFRLLPQLPVRPRRLSQQNRPPVQERDLPSSESDESNELSDIRQREQAQEQSVPELRAQRHQNIGKLNPCRPTTQLQEAIKRIADTYVKIIQMETPMDFADMDSSAEQDVNTEDSPDSRADKPPVVPRIPEELRDIFRFVRVPRVKPKNGKTCLDPLIHLSSRSEKPQMPEFNSQRHRDGQYVRRQLFHPHPDVNTVRCRCGCWIHKCGSHSRSSNSEILRLVEEEEDDSTNATQSAESSSQITEIKKPIGKNLNSSSCKSSAEEDSRLSKENIEDKTTARPFETHSQTTKKRKPAEDVCSSPSKTFKIETKAAEKLSPLLISAEKSPADGRNSPTEIAEVPDEKRNVENKGAKTETSETATSERNLQVVPGGYEENSNSPKKPIDKRSVPSSSNESKSERMEERKSSLAEEELEATCTTDLTFSEEVSLEESIGKCEEVPKEDISNESAKSEIIKDLAHEIEENAPKGYLEPSEEADSSGKPVEKFEEVIEQVVSNETTEKKADSSRAPKDLIKTPAETMADRVETSEDTRSDETSLITQEMKEAGSKSPEAVSTSQAKPTLSKRPEQVPSGTGQSSSKLSAPSRATTSARPRRAANVELSSEIRSSRAGTPSRTTAPSTPLTPTRRSNRRKKDSEDGSDKSRSKK